MSRSLVIVAALALGCVAGLVLDELRARERSADLAVRADAGAREAAQLRLERDTLLAELAESRRAARELQETSDVVRNELETRLARLEELIAALVGTRQRDALVPTPMRSPEDKEVLEAN